MRSYLLLMSVSKANAASAKTVLANLKKTADSVSDPLWIDAHGIGVFVQTDKVAYDLWSAALVGTQDFKDAMIVELGGDWAGRQDAKTTHWLQTHLGSPLRPPLPPRR